MKKDEKETLIAEMKSIERSKTISLSDIVVGLILPTIINQSINLLLDQNPSTIALHNSKKGFNTLSILPFIPIQKQIPKLIN